MTAQMTIRLPDDLYEALRKEAFTSRRPMNTIIADSLRWLDMDARAEQYGLLCNLFEAAWHQVVPGSLDDLEPVVSKDSRALALLATEVMGR